MPTHRRKPCQLIAAATAALLVTGALAPSFAEEEDLRSLDRGSAETLHDIVRGPTDLAPPIKLGKPERVIVDLTTIEVTGRLDDGTPFRYWTFNGKVPGPFVRVRVGDTVEVRMANAGDSTMMHNVDFHAVTGPGGGGGATLAIAGETKSFTFKALNPGLYVYHCATPPVAWHIAKGMYGLILVEPEGGLPPVDARPDRDVESRWAA